MTLDVDEYLRHQLYLDRLASGSLNSAVYPSLETAYKAIRAIIADNGVPVTAAQLDRLTASIREQIMSDKGWATVTTEMEQMAVYESAYQASTAGKAFPVTMAVPKDSKITKWVSKSIMSLTSGNRVDAGVWGDFVAANLQGRAQAINSLVANGYAKGQTVGQLTKAIKGSFDGIIRREAESLARTGFIHYASQAGEAMIQENADILEQYYYVVTFDSRTSDICQGVTKFNVPSKRFDVGDIKAPFPPLHFNAVAGGEMVLTESGQKPIEFVRVGENVVTHKGRLKPVIAVMKKANDSGVIRIISLDSGRVIRVTNEHPVLVNGVGWIRADGVKVGDRMFEKIVDKPPRMSMLKSIFKKKPNNYPSIFDSEEVFFEVGLESGCMASSINLNNNFMAFDGEIPNAVRENELVSEGIKPDIAKESNKGLFALNHCGTVGYCHSGKYFGLGFWIAHWIRRLHSFGVSKMRSGIMLGHSVSPVRFADANSVGNSCFGTNLGRGRLIKRLDSVNSAPSAHSSIGKLKLSLNSAKGFSHRVIMKLKKFVEIFSINKFNHWDSPSVTSITTVAHDDCVYNLEVEHDNTYLVDSVVVHNCRTRRIGVPVGWEPQGTRAAVGGQKGSEAEEAFKARQGRTDKKIKYRGRKDSNIFKSGEVDASLTYDQWLRTQPDWFIKDTLGAKRAELFEKGTPLASFSDMTGRPLTLKEIMQRNPIK